MLEVAMLLGLAKSVEKPETQAGKDRGATLSGDSGKLTPCLGQNPTGALIHAPVRTRGILTVPAP